MKKVIAFFLFLIILFSIYLFYKNKAKDYSIDYKYNNYTVKESYYMNKGYYTFTIDNKYDFAIEHKYTSRRHLIDNINKNENCLSITVFNKKTEFVCLENNIYTLKKEYKENKKINSYDNITIYSNKYDIYNWNNFGITNLITKEKYNFLKNESYDNNLFYQYNNYLIFADYDSDNTFNKFYVFNNNTKKLSSFKFDYNIHFKSYFMGDISNYIYLYDTVDFTQYKINISKKKIEISSDKNGLNYYNDGFTMVDKNHFSKIFINNKVYNYNIITENNNNILVYKTFKSKNNIIIESDLDTEKYIYANNQDIFYIKGNTLYHVNLLNGYEKIVDNFEWNFNYKDKVFIFN